MAHPTFPVNKVDVYQRSGSWVNINSAFSTVGNSSSLDVNVNPLTINDWYLASEWGMEDEAGNQVPEPASIIFQVLTLQAVSEWELY